MWPPHMVNYSKKPHFLNSKSACLLWLQVGRCLKATFSLKLIKQFITFVELSCHKFSLGFYLSSVVVWFMVFIIVTILNILENVGIYCVPFMWWCIWWCFVNILKPCCHNYHFCNIQVVSLIYLWLMPWCLFFTDSLLLCKPSQCFNQLNIT